MFSDVVAGGAADERSNPDAGEGFAPARTVIADVVARHGGRVIDSHGAAGSVAVFAGPSAAVATAAALRREVAEVRLGMSAGEVTITAGGHVGETVVEAARVLALAGPGQVVVTDLLVQMLPPELDGARPVIAFESMGEHVLKGLPEPVGVARLGTCADFSPEANPGSDAQRAVLAVDLVASTERLARDGAEATADLRSWIDERVDQAIARNGGTLLDRSGDGVVAEFPTATDAIEVAQTVDRILADRALSADAGGAVLARAGVAVGPRDGGGVAVAGSALLEASRLEAAAPPAGVLVSELAWRLSRGRFQLDIEHPREPNPGLNELSSGEPAGPDCYRLSPTRAPALLVLPAAMGGTARFPMVGRDEQMTILKERWSEALSGRVAPVMISGEPGIGKSRLALELGRSVHDSGALVLFGACDPDLDVPYRPFAAALAEAAGLDARIDDAVNGRPSPLAPLFAAARPDGEDKGSREVAPTDRLALFDSVVEALVGLSQRRPTLLVLEDLHWATPGTVLLLRRALEAAPECRLMVLGTYRSGEVGRGHPLVDLFALTHERRTVARLGVDGLGEDDVVALVQHSAAALSGAEAAEVARRIHSETGGSPFFAGELLAHRATGSATRLPSSVREVVSTRLNGLGEATYDVLSLAAVIGLAFELDLVAEVTQRALDEVIELVERAEAAALVTETDKAGRYRFNHAIVRTTLNEELSATRLAVAHRRIAEALEALPGDRVDELARHWRLAIGADSRDKAIEYLNLAGERDVAALAWEAAIERYGVVIDLLGQQSGTDPARLAAAHLAQGGAMRTLGDAAYLDAMAEAGRLARLSGRSDLLAQAAVGRTKPGSWFTSALDTDHTIIGFCEEALEGLASDDPMRVRVLATLATSRAFDTDWDRRVALVDEAVRLARASGDQWLIASSLVADHLALWHPTTLEHRRQIAEELALIAARRGDPELEFLARFFDVSHRLELADVAGAVRGIGDLVAPIAATRSFWFQFLVDRCRLGLDIALGRPTGSVPALRDDVDDLFTRSVQTQADASGTWAAQLGGLAVIEGRMGEMADALSDAASRRPAQGIWDFAVAIAHLERGDEEAATAVASEWTEPNWDFMWMVAQQMKAEVGLGLGRRDICRQARAALEPFRGRLGVIASGTLTWGLVSTSLGQAALGEGDDEVAEDLFREAIRDADRLGLQYAATLARRLLVTAMLGQDQPDPAELRRLTDEALALSETYGYDGEARRVRDLAPRWDPGSAERPSG